LDGFFIVVELKIAVTPAHDDEFWNTARYGVLPCDRNGWTARISGPKSAAPSM